MRSLAVKTLERRADGVIVPHCPVPPLSVIEFQFGQPRLDPRTKPWISLVRSIVLPDELRRLARVYRPRLGLSGRGANRRTEFIPFPAARTE